MKVFDYALIEHRPHIEVSTGLSFGSTVENLQDHPELWEKECPYDIAHGRVVTVDEAKACGW